MKNIIFKYTVRSLYFIFLTSGGVHPFRKLNYNHESTPDLDPRTTRTTVPTNRRPRIWRPQNKHGKLNHYRE